MSFIYLDNNATTALLSEVADAMGEVMVLPYGNPSSPHSVGEGTRGLIEDARIKVAELINAEPEQLVFTSCGSEANNQAILSGVVVNARKKLLMGILERTGLENLGLVGNKPDMSIFRTVLLHSGLYYPISQKMASTEVEARIEDIIDNN